MAVMALHEVLLNGVDTVSMLMLVAMWWTNQTSVPTAIRARIRAAGDRDVRNERILLHGSHRAQDHQRVGEGPEKMPRPVCCEHRG